MTTDKDFDFAFKVLETEGLGYSLVEYYGPYISGDVDDPQIVNLWAKSWEGIYPLKAYLQHILDTYEVDKERQDG